MRFKTGIIIASVLGIGGAVAATGYFLRETPEFFESESTIGGFKGIIVNGLTEQPLPDATYRRFRRPMAKSSNRSKAIAQVALNSS